MESGDRAVDEYLSLEPTSFDFVEHIAVQQYEIWEDIYNSRYVLSIEIWLSQYASNEPHPQLRLRFEEVQELCFREQFSPLTLHLNIQPLHQDQWEHLRYAVTDREGRLSFYSRSFKAELSESHSSAKLEHCSQPPLFFDKSREL